MSLAKELNKVFVLGELMAVFSGPALIAIGSFVEADDSYLTFTDLGGQVRFLRLGDAINIIKLT